MCDRPANGRSLAAASSLPTLRHSEWGRSGSGSYRRQYKSSVVYEYEVNGRQYCGDRADHRRGHVGDVPRFAKRTAAKYPFGSEVEVDYDPRNPGESVLRPHSWLHLMIFLVAGVMLTLAWAVGMGRM